MAIPSNPKFVADVIAEFGANSLPSNEEKMFAGCYNKIFGSYPAGSKLGDFGGKGKPSASVTSASGITYNSATLNGSLNPNGLSTAYKFQYRVAAGGSWIDTAWAYTGSSQSVSKSISSLLSGTIYEYRIVSYNNFNDNSSDWLYSSTTTFATSAPPYQAPPRNVFASYNSFRSEATISWTDPTSGNPDLYRIQYQVNGGYWNILNNSVSGTLNSFTATMSFSFGDEVIFRVAAYNSSTGAQSTFASSNIINVF